MQGKSLKHIFLHSGYQNGCVSGKLYEKKKESIVAIECLLGDWCQLVNK